MRRVRSVVVGLAAACVTLTGCGFHGLYDVALPGGTSTGNHPYTVTVKFADVLDLVPQANVKANDVAVGKVQSISLDGWAASVKILVRGDVHLPANARAAVRMTSLLGEKYVDLEQPLEQPQGQLGNNAVIPLTRTGTAPEVEEVLGALSLVLNGGGLEQIRTITTELNKALHGNEGATRDLLSQLNTFVGTLDKQKNEIITALQNIDKLAATLNQQKQRLINALDILPQGLAVLAQERGKMTTLLSSLANLGTVATGVITATQQNFVSGLKSLSPVLESLTAAGNDLPEGLRILLTYPFPIGKTLEFVKGDYANLHLYLDMNLTNNLCGLNPSLCGVGTTGASSPASPLASAPAATNSAGTQMLGLPTIPGAGR